MPEKPPKPSPDYPLFPHAAGQWAKKIKGKMVYFGLWDDPQAALDRYHAWLAGRTPEKPAIVTRNGRPGKPHKDYPLYPHGSGQWAKRVRGKVHYFGTDPDAALAKWLKDKDDLLAGRKPPRGDGLTVGRLSNLFLEAKQRLVDSGELKPATWYDYHRTCERIIKALGPGRHVANLRSIDFEHLRADFATTHNSTTLSDDITRSRVLFKYAFDSDLIDRPVKYGQGFKKPGRATLARNARRNPAACSKRKTCRRSSTRRGCNCGRWSTWALTAGSATMTAPNCP